MITTEKLTKSYHRKQVLRGVTFTARPGEVTLLIGPNGAGKSTILRVLTGLARADDGHALIVGKDIAREKLAAQRQLSFLPQTPNFPPRFPCAPVFDFST